MQENTDCSLMNLEVKLMNKTNTLPKRFKFEKKEPNRNSKAEDLSQRDKE